MFREFDESCGSGGSGETASVPRIESVIEVLVVDDHELFRKTLVLALQSRPGIRVVGSAKDGSSGVELAKRLRPEVVLMDMRMPRMDGFEANRQITTRLPGTCVFMMSVLHDTFVQPKAKAAGARAFLVKGDDLDEIVQAICSVRSGPRRSTRPGDKGGGDA